MKHLALVLAVVLAISAPVAAQDYNDGLEAYGRGDYATAFRILRPLAEKGDAGAQNNIGVMYAQGQGVPTSYVQAWKWLTLAASRYPDQKDRNRATKARDYVSALLSPNQIVQAASLVREWMPRE